MTERNEIVPTWRGILPLLVEVAANGTSPKGRAGAMAELNRLADAVDSRNDAAELLLAALAMLERLTHPAADDADADDARDLIGRIRTAMGV